MGLLSLSLLQLLHGMKVIDGDKSVWMLSMILPASDAAKLKGILACFEQANECTLFLVLSAYYAGAV